MHKAHYLQDCILLEFCVFYYVGYACQYCLKHTLSLLHQIHTFASFLSLYLFNLKNNKKEAAKNEKSLKFQCNKLIALTQKNVKITESAVYPNFNSILIAFAYKKYKALYLIINKHGASDDDAKKITLESICYPITTQKIGLNIAIKKNGGLNIWLLAANSEYKKINENIVINILLKAVE